MLKTLRNAWKIEDLRKKLTFTLMILIIYRVGCAIPVPFIDPTAMKSMLSSGDGNMLGYLNMLSGGAFANATLFALGVLPYINASIIMTLLTVAIPYLENLSKLGDEGRRKIAKITRYVGAGLGSFLSIAYYFLLRNQGSLAYTEGLEGAFAGLIIVLSFLAGTLLVMWLGEQVDKQGIGNGISLIIFTGIVSRLSSSVTLFTTMIKDAIENQQTQNFFLVPLFLVLAVLAVAFAVILNTGERRIPVTYAKRVVGRKLMGGQSSYLPIKVNMSGVMPIIFAGAITSIPGTIVSFFPPKTEFWIKFWSGINYRGVIYMLAYAGLIILFNFFYVQMQYEPTELANNLRKNNGTIPGFRPGDNTAQFIRRVLNKITFIGALFLVVVAVGPIVMGNITKTSIQLGGTSLLIVVGVALDTANQLESQMISRHHKGFLE